MLRTEIIKWIDKTFGAHRPGDRLELTDKITDELRPPDKGNGVFRIEEITFAFQRKKNEPREVGEKAVRGWKADLDKMTGNSVQRFHFGNEQLYSKASPLDIHEGAAPDQLVTGKSTLLRVQIYRENIVAVTGKIPKKHPNH